MKNAVERRADLVDRIITYAGLAVLAAALLAIASIPVMLITLAVLK